MSGPHVQEEHTKIQMPGMLFLTPRPKSACPSAAVHLSPPTLAWLLKPWRLQAAPRSALWSTKHGIFWERELQPHRGREGLIGRGTWPPGGLQTRSGRKPSWTLRSAAEGLCRRDQRKEAKWEDTRGRGVPRRYQENKGSRWGLEGFLLVPMLHSLRPPRAVGD